MGDENRHKKEFHFDLSYAALKERGLEKKAYSLIKAFMEQHGFDHIQYSGYRSREPMFTTEAYKVLGELHETFSWFHPCLKAAA